MIMMMMIIMIVTTVMVRAINGYDDDKEGDEDN